MMVWSIHTNHAAGLESQLGWLTDYSHLSWWSALAKGETGRRRPLSLFFLILLLFFFPVGSRASQNKHHALSPFVNVK